MTGACWFYDIWSIGFHVVGGGSSANYYYVKDALGNVVSLVSGTSIVANYTYNAWEYRCLWRS